MDSKRRIERHTWAGNAPGTWQSCAENLLGAAAVLRRQRLLQGPEPVQLPAGCLLQPPELMLSGMAVECLCKALWLKRDGTLAKDGKFIGVPAVGMGGHDLVTLSTVVGLDMSDAERDCLQRLSQFIVYGGRYPIPKNAEDLRMTKRPGGGESESTSWNSPGDQCLLDGLLARLNHHLSGSA